MRFAREVRSGVVRVNSYRDDDALKHMPMGTGYKQSGIGREWGPEGLDALPETKSIMVVPSRAGEARLKGVLSQPPCLQRPDVTLLLWIAELRSASSLSRGGRRSPPSKRDSSGAVLRRRTRLTARGRAEAVRQLARHPRTEPGHHRWRARGQAASRSVTFFQLRGQLLLAGPLALLALAVLIPDRPPAAFLLACRVDGDPVLQLDDFTVAADGGAPGPVRDDPPVTRAPGLRPRGGASGPATGRLWDFCGHLEADRWCLRRAASLDSCVSAGRRGWARAWFRVGGTGLEPVTCRL